MTTAERTQLPVLVAEPDVRDLDQIIQGAEV
jgi:hypothetical protein